MAHALLVAALHHLDAAGVGVQRLAQAHGDAVAEQREERLDILLDRMKECNLNEEDYWWYVNLRRYGGTKHAGYGLGFERIVMYLTGVSNIRDVIPYPRTVGNAEY